jgi:hypothetical protein
MRQTNRLPREASWPVVATPGDEATKFVPPPLPANDTAPASRLSRSTRNDEAPPCLEERFFRVVEATASWAVSQTIFGFAAYGASLYPYFLEPGEQPDEYVPPAPTAPAARVGNEPQNRSDRPARRVGADREAGAAGVRGTASLLSRCARFGAWLIGDARPVERQPRRHRHD